MAKTDSVDRYIAAQSARAQTVLARVRATIRKAVPAAAESISYRMPTYTLPGGPVLYFAGWKQHYSLYPATPLVTATFEHELAPYQVNKGTIRFPLDAPVPAALIGRIAKLRAHEVAARTTAKRPAKATATPSRPAAARVSTKATAAAKARARGPVKAKARAR